MTLKHIFNFATFSHCPIIIFIVELRSRTFASTPSKHSIIVQRKSVHAMTYVFHQHFSPVIVIIAGTAGNLEQTVAIVVTAISRITAIQIGIVFRTHATSASPAFISHSEVFYFPRFFTSVFQTQFCHRASLFRSHIFYPLGHFFHAAATYVSADIRFTAQHFAQVQEFVCSEAVIFYGSSPVVVDHTRTFFTRTNTVHPMVFIGKASSRPAEYRHFQVFQCFEHIFTITFNIRYGRIFSYPKTSIDTCTEVFGKLTINFLIDDLFSLLRMNSHCSLLLSA